MHVTRNIAAYPSPEFATQILGRVIPMERFVDQTDSTRA